MTAWTRSRVLDRAVPGLAGQVIADALVGAFAHHYRCELAGDAELLQRIGHPPGDALPAGLMILSALAGFCRSSSPSVLQRAA